MPLQEGFANKLIQPGVICPNEAGRDHDPTAEKVPVATVFPLKALGFHLITHSGAGELRFCRASIVTRR